MDSLYIYIINFILIKKYQIEQFIVIFSFSNWEDNDEIWENTPLYSKFSLNKYMFNFSIIYNNFYYNIMQKTQFKNQIPGLMYSNKMETI